MSWKYPPWADSYLDSIIGSERGDGDEYSEILEAVERAKEFKLCLRRIWAFSSSLSRGARSLPSLIPAADMFSVPKQKRQHHEHEQCTFDFCEHSRLDFTSVEQHHEDCKGDASCVDFQFKFPLDLLDNRVRREGVTAWKLVTDTPDDSPSLIDPKQPYMAVSHVWADGTGAGTWGPGKVNPCLYRFFCGIAREFQCEGCWWDTISIPRTDDLRNKALNNMHNNYSNARFTLVHDLYLREWEWVDAETACFAIVMSPWYSRGWTALELARSHKVKILFKARNDRFVVKDLDVDILDEVSQHHPTAKAIRTLRMAKIETFGDLSSILSPRDTSKPRDIPIISGLLAGVDVSGDLSQQEIYQRILRKLGKVAQGHLFHNSATMAAPGFSWCPTNILDMPMTEIKSKSEWLDLQENGDLEGTWKVYPTDSVKFNDFVWHGTHALTRASLKSALGEKRRNQHLLLAENLPGECTRALLVRPMRCEGRPIDVLFCRFVGPVYFHPALGNKENGCSGQDLECRVLKVRITNDDRMQKIEAKAWDFARGLSNDPEASKEGEVSHTDSAEAPSTNEDDDFSWHDMKALLFLKTNTEMALDELFRSPKFLPTSQPESSDGTSRRKSSDGMVMHCTFEDNSNNNSPESIKAFFYGREEFFDNVKEWLRQSTAGTQETHKAEEIVKTGEMMHLSLDKNGRVQVDAGENLTTDPYLDEEALQLAVEHGKESMALPLVRLLLDNGASCVFNTKVKTGEDQNEMHSGLHLAANKGCLEIAKEFISRMKNNLDARGQDKRTALVVAVQKGEAHIVQHLLYNDAATDVPDEKEQIPLHYAALNDDQVCAEALLGHAKTKFQKNAKRATSDGASDEKPHDDTENNSSVENEDKSDSDGCKPPDQGDLDQMYRQFALKANLDTLNGEKKTALQLASENGNLEVMKLLLKYGADPHVSDPSGQTALALAAKHGCVEVVEILLRDQPKKDQSDKDRPNKDLPDKYRHILLWRQDELDAALLAAFTNSSRDKAEMLKDVVSKLISVGAKSGPADVDGTTALHWATKIRDKGETIAKSLIGVIEQGHEHLDKPNRLQQSALVMAAFHGRKEVVTALLEKGANIESRDSRSRTALHWAVAREHVEIVKELANKNKGVLLNASDEEDHTALQLAAQIKGSSIEPILKALLEAGADTSRPDQDGRCALMMAAESRATIMVKMLLGKNCNPLREDRSGNTALGWAAMKGFDDVVNLILEHSEKTLKDQAVEHALKLAVQQGHLDVSMMLHEKIKDARLQDSLVSTILFSSAAAADTSTPTTERLMKLVKDPNLQDTDGQTALMFAVQYKKQPLLDRLLELGADPDKSDYRKVTPLMLAAKRNDRRSVDALLGAKANANIQDHRDYTALHYAAEYGHFTLMRYITLWGDSTHLNMQNCHKKTALHIALETVETPSSNESLFSFVRRERFNRLNSDLRTLPRVIGTLLMFGAQLDKQDEEKQTPLHWAIRTNRIDIVQAILENNYHKVDMDLPDAEGRTPLLLAAERGYSSIVQLLMKYAFDPDSQDKKGRTPLLLAAEGGDESSVRALLDKKANPNLMDKKSRTALIKAAQHGYLDIVRLLTDKQMEGTKHHRRENAYLDARDDMGRTALMLAAESGHREVVKDLQKKGADSSLIDHEEKKAWQKAMDKGHTDIVDSLLYTPDAPNQDLIAVNQALLVASRRGWTELVEVLLNRKADVTFQHEEGTALHMAAMGGHSQVVKKLLETGIGGIVALDKRKRTALMLATEHGFESIVELLLAQQDIKDAINDWMGPEALRCAAEKDNRGIVRRLLESNTDPNGCDSDDRTALMLAAGNGNKEIVGFLLKHQAHPNSKDKQHRTALHHAAWGGHDGVVKSLLEWEAEMNALDNHDQVALHLAAERASESVVQLLVAKGANPNAKSKDGQNPLHRAAWGGSRDIVNLLRQRGADSSLQDNSGNKPWQVAAEKGFESIVEMLLEDEENIRDEQISHRKALIFASQKGHTAMAKALLDKGADSMVIDEDGLTPLHWAAKRGDDGMVKLLIESGGQNMKLDATDNHQQTPLWLAVQERRATVVRILLEKGADPNIVGQEGQTVLHIAAKENIREVFQILVNHKVDAHVRDDQKQKAWLLAAKSGHHHIARSLLKREVDFNPRSHKIEELFLELAGKGFVPMVDLLLENGVNKDAVDRFGRSAIATAAERKQGDVVKLLLSVGANPRIPDSNLQTPLLWAAKNGDQRIMKMLLDNIPRNNVSSDATSKQLLNHTDSKGRTALLIALKNKHDEVAKLLLLEDFDDKIELNHGDTTGKTALHWAAEKGNDDLLRLLLNRSAKPTVQDALGRTPLFMAADCEQVTAVEVLLSTGYNAIETIDIPDLHHRTVLHVAAERGYTSMARMLLDLGVGKDHRDDLGRTPMSLAVENGHKEVVDLLLEKKAKPGLPDHEERTALSLAVANGDRSIVEALLDLPLADVGAIDESGWTLLQLAVQSGNREVTWLVAEHVTQVQGPRRNPLGQRPSQGTSNSSDGGS